MSRIPIRKFSRPTAFILGGLLFTASVPQQSFASAMACAAVISNSAGLQNSVKDDASEFSVEDQKLLQAASQLDEILNGPAHLQEIRASEFIDSTFLQTVNELSKFLHDQNNYLPMDVSQAPLRKKSEQNIDLLNKSLPKIIRMANNEAGIIGRLLTLRRGSSEKRLAELETKIQYAHFQALENREQLLRENSQMTLLIQDVQNKIQALGADSSLLQSMLKTLKSSGASPALEYKFIRAQESISLLQTVADGLIQSTHQRMQLNSKMVDLITAQTSGTIPLASASMKKPVNLMPRSLAQKIIADIRLLKVKERSTYFVGLEIPTIKTSELFEIMSLLSEEHERSFWVYERYSSHLSDQIDQYGFDWIVKFGSKINSNDLQKVLHVSGGRIPLTEFFRLNEITGFLYNPLEIFAAIPRELYPNLDQLREWVSKKSFLLSSEYRVARMIVEANHLTVKENDEWNVFLKEVRH